MNIEVPRHHQRSASANVSMLSGHRPDDRLNVRPSITFYYQEDRDRLFVCHNAEQAVELRRLCGDKIAWVRRSHVKMRRLTNPFVEEVDLKKITA